MAVKKRSSSPNKEKPRKKNQTAVLEEIWKTRNARAMSIRTMLKSRARASHPATARSGPIPVRGKNRRVTLPAARKRKTLKPVRKLMRLPLNKRPLAKKKRTMNSPVIKNRKGGIAVQTRLMKPVIPATLTPLKAGWI
jgi:hypothetical protein